PGGAVAGNVVGGQPLAVDVTGEVDAGIDGRVEVAGEEAVDAREAGLVELQSAVVLRRRGGVAGGRRFVRLVRAGRDGGGDGKGQQQYSGLGQVHGGSGRLGKVCWVPPRTGGIAAHDRPRGGAAQGAGGNGRRVGCRRRAT